MITKTQQHIIDSITIEFERINKIESKPMSKLAQQIKGEIAEYDSKQDDFRVQTKSYELANKNLFEDICLQIEDLCNGLGLELETYVDGKIDGYTHIRTIRIHFPHFVDPTIASGDVYFTIYVNPFRTNRYGISGLERVGLYYQEGLQKPVYYQNNVLDFIAEKIVKIHKQYSK